MLKDRTTRRDWLWLALLGLLVHGLWGLRLDYPSYFDAYFYTINARRLANGAGLTTEVIWQFLDAPTSLPAPAFTYWMPLPSLLAAAGYWLIDSFRGAQIPFWLMTGLLPLLSYAISWHLMSNRRQARVAALFTLGGGYYAAYFVQPSTFALFGLVGAGCLLALAMALKRRTARIWLLTGLLAGLAHLTRADGVLLIGLGGLLWLQMVIAGWRQGELAWQRAAWQLAALLVGYLLVMGGWFWRTYQVTGRPLSTVGTQTIFLTTYDDLFAYGRSFTLENYLAWGWGNILRSKLRAIWLATQTFVAVTGLTAFTGFMIWGWLRLLRRSETRRFLLPFTWYTVLLYGVMSLVFTFPGQRGSLLHSSTALWPWSMALAAAGIDFAVEWIAKKRRSWRPRQAKRLFSVAFVVMVLLISLVISQRLSLGDEEVAVFKSVARQVPDDAVVMIGGAPDFHYHTGLRAMSVPNEPVDGLVKAATELGATHVLLSPDHPQPLDEVYTGDLTDSRLQEIWTDDTGEYQLYRIVPAG